MNIIKAHAYGNDFLFVREDQTGDRDSAELARITCARNTGVGADGLIFYRRTESGARMKLVNADGSQAEISGNAVRCLAAIVLRYEVKAPDYSASLNLEERPEPQVVIETQSGNVPLVLLGVADNRYTFRAMMGSPRDIRMFKLDIAGEGVQVVTLSVGNPHCVILGPPLDEARLRRLGPALSCHSLFPDGTNVELVEVETTERIRILIWERGVGETSASGTGACAAAVAAMTYSEVGGEVEVISKGGSQRVAWHNDGLYLTGWAEVSMEGQMFL